MVHKFLVANKRSGVFVGINGNGAATYEIADKPGTYKGVAGSTFYSIGVNVIKQKIFTAIRNFDQERGAFRIWAQARLPKDYAKQLTAEKMEIKRSQGLDRVVFTNEKQKRNEALDTLVYSLAAKAYIKIHRGRQGRMLFQD
jgi:phage terminase large subunit GpA-like protein